jgi:hypothetical protein
MNVVQEVTLRDKFQPGAATWNAHGLLQSTRILAQSGFPSHGPCGSRTKLQTRGGPMIWGCVARTFFAAIAAVVLAKVKRERGAMRLRSLMTLSATKRLLALPSVAPRVAPTAALRKSFRRVSRLRKWTKS